MAERVLIGLVAAALLTALARRFGTLSESGQWAAVGCGVAAAAAGWPWAFLLVAYFAAASAVTGWGGARKAERTQRATVHTAQRTAAQVLANGAIFALLALNAGPAAASTAGLAAAGALAAASADTWATEIGTLWGGAPRSIVNWQPTPVGLSGGITVTGTIAGIGGAALVATLAALLHQVESAWPYVAAVAAGGIVGCAADSVIGATLQARRWCDHCKVWTERRVHPCSYRTVHAGGFRWVTNDVVNGATTLVGAAGAAGAGLFVR